MKSDKSPSFSEGRLQRLPPLRIHHLLATTVTVAAVGTIYAALMQSRAQAPPLYFACLIAATVAQGTAATTLAFGLSWTKAGVEGFFRQPGHWFLAVATLELARSLAGPLLFAMANRQGHEFGSNNTWLPVLLFGVLPRVAAAFLLVLAACQFGRGDPWHRLLMFVGAGQFVHAIELGHVLAAELSPHPGSPSMWVFKLMLSACTAIFVWLVPLYVVLKQVSLEFTSGSSRHWSHWCGVATWTVLWAIYLMQSFAMS